MERIVQAIQVDDKNIADIFKLPCVSEIRKDREKGMVQIWIYLHHLTKDPITYRKCCFLAYPSDWLCQYDDGSWEVLSNDKYQSLRLLF